MGHSLRVVDYDKPVWSKLTTFKTPSGGLPHLWEFWGSNRPKAGLLLGVTPFKQESEPQAERYANGSGHQRYNY